IVALTADRCRVRQYRELVEISGFPTPYFGSPCINHLAQQCRPFHHEMLRACEPHRYRHNDSPNVLLVDYPEVDPDSPSSVFTAVFHQNVRNVHKHRREQCQVRVDAAVRRPSQDDESLFFVGSKIIVFSHSSRVQTREIEVPGVTAVEAAYISGESQITVIKGCESLRLNSTSLQPLDSDWTRISSSCDASLDAAESRDGTLYVFRGCYVIAEGQTPKHLSSLGLPCDVDAALNFGGETFVFKYSHFWIRREGEHRRGKNKTRRIEENREETRQSDQHRRTLWGSRGNLHFLVCGEDVRAVVAVIAGEFRILDKMESILTTFHRSSKNLRRHNNLRKSESVKCSRRYLYVQQAKSDHRSSHIEHSTIQIWTTRAELSIHSRHCSRDFMTPIICV
ncbi:hypothetical protein RRG08_013623, partial [Elysia crispata]